MIRKTVFLLLLTMCILTGCTLSPGAASGPDTGTSSGLSLIEPVADPNPEPEPAPAYDPVDTAAEDFSSDLERRAAEHIDPAVNAGIALLNDYPDDGSLLVLDYDPARYPAARERLTEEQQGIYDLLWETVSQFGDYAIEEKGLSGGFGTFVGAEDALREDHPELFLCYGSNTNSRTYTPRYFAPNHTREIVEDREVCRQALDFYRAVFSRILACMPEGLTNWQKCLYFSGVIMAAAEYDEARNNLEPFQAYNALVTGCTVCQGYTQAFRLLCHAAGVDCRSLPGQAGGGAHIWNALETEQGLRFVDLTFTDSWCRNNDVPFTTRYFFMDEEDLDFIGYEPEWDNLK